MDYSEKYQELVELSHSENSGRHYMPNLTRERKERTSLRRILRQIIATRGSIKSHCPKLPPRKSETQLHPYRQRANNPFHQRIGVIIVEIQDKRSFRRICTACIIVRLLLFF